MKYLKQFKQASAYEAYKNGSDYVLPNVSYVEDNNVVYYNPFAESTSGVIMAHYNATEDNMLALADTSNVKSLKVNGTEVEFNDTYYFSEVGEYDVEIELIDPTLINGATMDYDGMPQSNSLFFDRESQGACLTSVNIPDSVTTIGNAAFAACLSLTDIHIGSGVTSIGDNAFNYCSGLTSVVIPDSVTTIGEQAFRYCSGLASVHIGSGVTSIEYGAFGNCTGLASVHIGSGVTSIGDNAFAYCIGLTGELIIPDSVISIGDGAFSICTGLTSIVIPNSVTTIGNGAFRYCSGLASITCNAITAPKIDTSTFQDVKQGGVLKVPEGSDYSSWMSTDEPYLGYYNWTIEYI